MLEGIKVFLRQREIKSVGLCLILVLCLSTSIRAQTSAFAFQSKLTDGGEPAEGQYDLLFKLFDSAADGMQIGADAIFDDVEVSNGTFTVTLDFGAAAFAGGGARYLEIAVRAGTSTGAYTVLAPRQEITAAPYSISAVKAASADSLNGACALCVTDAQIQSVSGSKVTGTVANAANATTAINVSGIVQIENGGTGSSTKNFVDLTTNQASIGGDKTFTGAVGVTGASGVFNGNGSGLTNLNGANIASGSVTSVQLAPDALPNSSNLKLLGLLRWDLLKGQKSFSVGNNPEGIAFDGANIWVANTGGETVTKLRASDGANLGSFIVGSAPIAVAFDGASVWITSGTNNQVTKLRASDGANLGTFPLSASPYGIAFDGANMWVVNGNNVTKLRASDGATLGTFPVGSLPNLIAFDGANMWIANSGSNNVTKLRASDGASLGTFAAGSSPYGVAFDGVSIWVTSSGSPNVTKIRASDGVNLGTVAVAAGQLGIAFDGANMWVVNGNSVTKLRASDNANLGTFTLGTFPAGVAFDGTNMWVVVAGNNSVTRLPPAFPQ